MNRFCPSPSEPGPAATGASARGLGRRLLAAAMLALALGGAAPEAWAHGGPPLPGPPPEPPPPPKPNVPPMPPPSPVPTPGEVPPPKPQLPPSTPRGGTGPTPQPPTEGPKLPNEGPTTPNVPRPEVTGRPGRPRPAATASGALDATDWRAWWLLARSEWLPTREAGRRAVALTGGDAPGSAPDLAAAAARQREALGRVLAEPLLLGLGADVGQDPDVRASSLLALARLSGSAAARALVEATARDARAPDLVRESAALALGLFRRSEPAAALAACDVEHLREVALDVIDDESAAERTRAFGAFALALLGDQAFLEGEVQGAAAWCRALWMRLARPRARIDLPVALLTALGHQPGAALPEAIRDGLKGMVVGRRTLGIDWSDAERAHALTALVRLDAEASGPDLVRTLGRRREADPIVRAAAIAAGAHATRIPENTRPDLYLALDRALEQAQDPWTRGLLRVAIGRVVAADLRRGNGLLAAGPASRVLLSGAVNAQGGERGYAVLALALVVHASESVAGSPDWVREARALLREGLGRTSEDDGRRAAYAVGLGLAGGDGVIPALTEAVGDRTVGAETRGHGAVALGMLGGRGGETQRALVLALQERGQESLRASAALALSWLGRGDALTLLLREAGDPEASERVLSQAAIALGRLGEPAAAGPLADLARDGARSAHARALAVVALGLVLDPEPRPSLARLASDACYPSGTEALRELLTIL